MVVRGDFSKALQGDGQLLSFSLSLSGTQFVAAGAVLNEENHEE